MHVRPPDAGTDFEITVAMGPSKVDHCTHDMYAHIVKHSYNKPEIPGQTVCYKQEFVISEQFPMRYCSTWLRSLLCYIQKFAIDEFVISVPHCTDICAIGKQRIYVLRIFAIL